MFKGRFFFLKKILFFEKNFKNFKKFCFFGPFGTLFLKVSRKKSKLFQVAAKNVYFSRSFNNLSMFNLFRGAFVSGLKPYVVELFVRGKVFRVTRLLSESVAFCGFLLVLGMKSLFKFFVARDSVFIGL